MITNGEIITSVERMVAFYEMMTNRCYHCYDELDCHGYCYQCS